MLNKNIINYIMHEIIIIILLFLFLFIIIINIYIYIYIYIYFSRGTCMVYGFEPASPHFIIVLKILYINKLI